MSALDKPRSNGTRAFIMCPGVGHIGRGYESFSRELFEELVQDPDIDLTLVKGAGPSSQKEVRAWCIKRTSRWATSIGKLLHQPAYHVEQISFFVSSLPLLLSRKPQVIVYSDFFLGVLLWYLKKYLHLRYKLLFSNGAPNGPPFSRCDLVQQLLPLYKDEAVKAGENPNRHVVLPYAIEMPTSPQLNAKEKSEKKKELGIQQEKVILCVAAINDSHKRISYLLHEVMTLNDPSICLVVLGQQNEESPAIIQKGKQGLPSRFVAKTVVSKELADYYEAADLFVLPSLTEGLPRVMLEALSYGLPVLSHDYPVGREVLQHWGNYADFTKTGDLTNLIQSVWNNPLSFDFQTAQDRRAYIQKQYSWETLKQQYKEMILQLANQDK